MLSRLARLVVTWHFAWIGSLGAVGPPASPSAMVRLATSAAIDALGPAPPVVALSATPCPADPISRPLLASPVGVQGAMGARVLFSQAEASALVERSDVEFAPFDLRDCVASGEAEDGDIAPFPLAWIAGVPDDGCSAATPDAGRTRTLAELFPSKNEARSSLDPRQQSVWQAVDPPIMAASLSAELGEAPAPPMAPSPPRSLIQARVTSRVITPPSSGRR